MPKAKYVKCGLCGSKADPMTMYNLGKRYKPGFQPDGVLCVRCHRGKVESQRKRK